MTAPLLEFSDFKLSFDTFDGVYQALDGVTLTLSAGESLGVVGETGCGKSITAKSVLGLVPSPPARVVGKDCSIDLLIDDLQEELRDRPYEIVFVAGGWQHRTRSRFSARSAPSGCP